MAKKIKLLLNALPVSFILLALTGCSNNNSVNNEQSADNSDNKDINQQIVQKMLAIEEYKCTGCGKCVRVDPEHFVFDYVSRKAEVISSDNLNSQNLTMAVSICRDQAIKLI